MAGLLWQDASVESTPIPGELGSWLGHRGDGWTIAASTVPDGSWTVVLEHPASWGKILQTGAHTESDALQVARRWLDADDEIRIVAAAPPLVHAGLCLGVRTFVTAFEWTNREVRGVAFLMYEHGMLDEPETAWLAGYLGEDAPVEAASPLGWRRRQFGSSVTDGGPGWRCGAFSMRRRRVARSRLALPRESSPSGWRLAVVGVDDFGQRVADEAYFDLRHGHGGVSRADFDDDRHGSVPDLVFAVERVSAVRSGRRCTCSQRSTSRSKR